MVDHIPALLTAICIGAMCIAAAALIVGGWSVLWGLLFSKNGLTIALITIVGITMWWVLVSLDLAY